MRGAEMTELLTVWRAGRVRRWHTNPHLSRTDDYVDGHGARVAALSLTLWPSLSRDGLIYALTHDHGEHAVGDMSYMVKIARPHVAIELDALENETRERMGFGQLEDQEERKVIKLADWLDAWLWVFHHEPHLVVRQDWLDQLSSALRVAAELGISAPVSKMVSDLTGT